MESFGALLKGWRKARSKSQLELSEIVGYSQRHLSFLESGRSNPSRSSVLALCDALSVPLRDRNELFNAAGLAPAYQARPLQGEVLADILNSIRVLIDRQDPTPTILVDDVWNLVHANSAALRLFTSMAVPGAALPDNVLEACFRDDVLKPAIANWTDVAAQFLARLRRDLAQDPNNRELAALYLRLEALAGTLEPGDAEGPVLSPVQTIAFNDAERPGRLLEFFSMIASIGHARDVNLAGLHIETFVPVNESTRHRLHELAA